MPSRCPQTAFLPPFDMAAEAPDWVRTGRLGANNQGSLTGPSVAVGLYVCLVHHTDQNICRYAWGSQREARHPPPPTLSPKQRNQTELRPRHAVHIPSCLSPAPAVMHIRPQVSSHFLDSPQVPASSKQPSPPSQATLTSLPWEFPSVNSRHSSVVASCKLSSSFSFLGCLSSLGNEMV